MSDKILPRERMFGVRFFLICLSLPFLSRCTFQGVDRVVHVHDGEIAIKEGDTIASLCMEHNVSIKDMVECNNLQPPYSLKGIDKLALPRGGGVGKAPKVGPQTDPHGRWSSDIDDDQSIDNDDGAQLDKNGKKDLWGGDTVVVEGADKIEGASSKEGGSHSFVYPVSAPRVSSLKGDALTLCFRTSPGTPVSACADGRVYFAGNMQGDTSGNIVIIRHDDDLSSVYRCLKNATVKEGDLVKKGKKFSQARGTLFKFELRKDRQIVDPRPYFKR